MCFWFDLHCLMMKWQVRLATDGLFRLTCKPVLLTDCNEEKKRKNTF